jgi:hypothetical protein
MRTLVTVTVAGWFIFSSILHAQSDWGAVQKLAAGTPVRVEAGSRRATGSVHSATDTELVVLNGSKDMARFDRKEIDRVEVFVGDPHPKRRGAKKGALWSTPLLIPATLGAEMGGMDRKALPFAYCLIVCGGAALGVWMADPPKTVVIYTR